MPLPGQVGLRHACLRVVPWCAEGISLPKQWQVRGELEFSLGQVRSPFPVASRKQIQKSRETHLGLGHLKGGAVSTQQQCFPSPRLQHPNGFLLLACFHSLLGCEDASFCRWDGSWRPYGLALPLGEAWTGTGLWPCCRDAVAAIAAGSSIVGTGRLHGSLVGLADLCP